ncbi:MAG: tRNA 2-selenouridine(34) synthase MnmH [Bacteroidales bacterium]
MNKNIDITTFFNLAITIPVIDVRSPGEFDNAHFPGAINLPLFNNDERRQVGICYKEKGRDDAIILGLELVGPKMGELAKMAKSLAIDGKLVVHCWRGGMRSLSMAWLMNLAGIETYTLVGGYKTYRRYLKKYFENKFNLVVLGGMTGSGKTEILKEIKKLGEQVLDLEKLANHKGSAFGALGQEEQVSTEQFENNLFKELSNFDYNKLIWLEDESQTIGKIRIPSEFFLQMRSAQVIKIIQPLNDRIKWLVKEYGQFDKELLKMSIEKIKKRLGGLVCKQAIDALENSDFEMVADIVLAYYDKTYSYGLSTRDNKKIHELQLDKMDFAENAKAAVHFFSKLSTFF